MTDDKNNPPVQMALYAVPKSREYLAKELRQMAAGKGEYSRFTYMSPWVKNIWRAAADMMEHDHKAAKKT